MSFLLIAKPINKDTLYFNGKLNGIEVENVLVCNRIFDENKTYMIAFDSYDLVGRNLIIDATKCVEVK